MHRGKLFYSALTLCALCLCGELLIDSHTARAHKFYASLAQADYNPRTKSLEVSMRVFADDLERALTKRAGRSVRIDGAPDIAAQITDYLRERFELRGRDGKIRELKWVGMAAQVDSAWLHFEIVAIENLDGASLRNRVLLEIYPDQVNTTIVKADGKQRDFIFRVGDEDWREVSETKAKSASQQANTEPPRRRIKHER